MNGQLTLPTHFFRLCRYMFCFNYIKDQENIMAYFTAHFVHNWDVKHTTVVSDMKALVYCQKFPFFRHVACFSKSTYTDNALKSCLYPMSAASLSGLEVISGYPHLSWLHRLTTADEWLVNETWNGAICRGYSEHNRPQLSELKNFKHASGCYGNHKHPNQLF